MGYNLSITPFVFLPGDNCSNAIPLSVGATCVPTAGSVAGMTQTIVAGVCGGTADDDVWYSFVATTPNQDVILDADFDAVLEVRSGVCNGANIACADNNFSTGIEQLNLTGLTVGATYYVRLWSWSSAVQTSPAFDICVVAGAAPFDPCVSIASISACDVPTGPVVSPSGNGSFNNYGGPYGTPGQERIFSFTAATTGVHQLNVVSLTGNWIDFFWKAAGTCDATGWNYVDDVIGTGVVIPSGTPLNFTAGTTYYIMWDAEDTGGRTVNFSIVCPPTPPANEACASASVLTLGATGTCPANAVTGNNGAAVQDGPDPACDSDGPWPDVWYVFNSGSNAIVNVDFTNISMSDIVIDVFDGSCAGASIYCGFNADFQLTGLTANSNYYIRVSSNSFWGTGGAHSVCVSIPPPPPANDLCANAIPVACNSVTNSTTVASTTIGAPADCNGLSLNTAGGIWYTVQGWDGPITVDLSGSSFDTKIGVFTGTCGDLVCVDSDDDDGAGLTSLVTFTGSASETYYLYVTGYLTNTGTVVMTVTCGSNNPACTENGLTLEVETDANFSQTSWEIIAQGSNVVALTGGGFPVQGIVTQTACLPDGCYRLRVLDSGGDGIAGGGYILRTQGDNQRVIDNRDNFTSGSVSAVIGNGGFCLPLGTDKLIYTSCDKLDWVNNEFIVAAPNPAVSAQWGVGDQTDDGYQFWWFDPNGSYGYTKFRNHATSDGFGPANATRACHARINNWTPATNIPTGVLMNVKVRSRVNGTNSAWGPVCRFKIDPVRAACPLTKLMDIPGNQFFSCGVTRTWGGNNRIHARPVDGATQYQFRFTNGELAAPRWCAPPPRTTST